MSSPAMWTAPASGVSRPASRCISVDLPEPDGPITAVNWPLRDLDRHAAQGVDGRAALAVGARQRGGGDGDARSVSGEVGESGQVESFPESGRGRTGVARARVSRNSPAPNVSRRRPRDDCGCAEDDLESSSRMTPGSFLRTRTYGYPHVRIRADARSSPLLPALIGLARRRSSSGSSSPCSCPPGRPYRGARRADPAGARASARCWPAAGTRSPPCSSVFGAIALLPALSRRLLPTSWCCPFAVAVRSPRTGSACTRSRRELVGRPGARDRAEPRWRRCPTTSDAALTSGLVQRVRRCSSAPVLVGRLLRNRLALNRALREKAAQLERHRADAAGRAVRRRARADRGRTARRRRARAERHDRAGDRRATADADPAGARPRRRSPRSRPPAARRWTSCAACSACCAARTPS